MSIRDVKNIQRVIKIPAAYTKEERRAIAAEIIDYIKKTSENGVSPVTGRKFKGYSKSYQNSLDFKIGGKSKEVTLRLSGDMLAAIDLLENKKGAIKIGYDESDANAGKAEGNQIGSYGKDSGTTGKARPFIGIKREALEAILAKYPLDNDDKRELRTDKTLAIEDTSDDIVDE